jgi:hypothetical protein
MSSETYRRQCKIQTCPFGCAVRMVLASIIILTSAIDEVHAGHGQSSGMGVSARPVGMGVSPKPVGMGVTAKPSGTQNPRTKRKQAQPRGMGLSPPDGGQPIGGAPTGGAPTGGAPVGGAPSIGGAPMGGTPMSSKCVTGNLVCPIWQPLHSQCRCPDNFGNYHSGQAQ